MDLPNGKTVLTRKGYEDIQRELDEASKKRPIVIQRIKDAIALGDLSENFDYHDAKREQGLLESKIAELKSILNNSVVVDCAEDGCINVGSKVVVREVDEEDEEEYLIVGPPESNPSQGKISYESVVGSALMGHSAGDIVSIESPGGEFKYEIISVS